MTVVAVCGAGVIGLSAAMMLARDGHEVTVLEGDPGGAPEAPSDAWSSWNRRGVAQFRQPHNLFPRFQHILASELAGLTERLESAGCVWVDPMAALPPTIVDGSRRPDDDRFRFVTGRRPVVESAFAAAADAEPRVTVRRGVRVTGLLAGPEAIAGTPHVTGVRTAAGDEVHADLVVDAMGRRTTTNEWLAELGARAPLLESENCGFVYYTRFFTGPTLPIGMAPPLTPVGSFSLLTLPGDNDTWSVTLFGSTGDAPIKAMRDPEVFTRVIRACSAHAHWLDAEPITEVLPMAGILAQYRRFVVDGAPVATGFAAVGDAWACTNPSAGRGLSVGLIHAQQLRATVRAHLDDHATFARAWDQVTEDNVSAYYWNQVRADRYRLAEMTAARQGSPAPAPEPMMARLMSASGVDASAFRALAEVRMCLATPQDAFARPEVAAAMVKVEPAPPAPPAISRDTLLQLLAG